MVNKAIRLNLRHFVNLLVNKNLSILSNCIAPWRTEKMKAWLKPLISNNREYNVDIHRPYNQLSPEEKKIIWEGKGVFKGIHRFFQYLEKKSYKIQFRIIAPVSGEAKSSGTQTVQTCSPLT